MSKYSLDYLRNHTIVGDVETNGAPWTARCLMSGADSATLYADTNGNGETWLFPAAIPLDRVRGLLDSFAVQSFPLAFVREYRAGDENNAACTVKQLAPGKPKVTIV